MNHHETETITGLLDGELKGLRRWRVVRHVRACPLCAAEYRRQRHVRRMLQANPPASQMSDSPEVFWSKVKREIEACERQPAKAPMPHPTVLDWLGRHSYVFATATMVVVAALSVVWMMQTRPKLPTQKAIVVDRGGVVSVEYVATVIHDTVATPVAGEDKSIAVIWVTGLPWSADMAELKTQFANLDS